MAIRCQPGRLQAELRVAGIAAGRIVSVRSGGPLATLDWASSPSAVEQATADGVMSAHDPDAEEKEQAALRTEIRDLWSRWDTLTAAELNRCVKHLMKRVFAAEIQ